MRDALETRLQKGRQSVSAHLGLGHWIVSGKEIGVFYKIGVPALLWAISIGIGLYKNSIVGK